MPDLHIATFESRTLGPIKVRRGPLFNGADESTRQALEAGSYHSGIVASLGTKDQHRYSRKEFPSWRKKNGGRNVYTAWHEQNLAGAIIIGPQPFPAEHYPNAPIQPAYTIAFRTAYDRPGGGTYEGERIAKLSAIIALADTAFRTINVGPAGLPPLTETGVWLETDTTNAAAQALYRNLGSIARNQASVGFTEVGVYQPPEEDGVLPPARVGMVLTPDMLRKIIAMSDNVVQFEE